jgi:hypothetical protein
VPLLEKLRPFGGRIAVIGQVGVVGPVAQRHGFAYSSQITIGRSSTSRGHVRSGPAPRPVRGAASRGGGRCHRPSCSPRHARGRSRRSQTLPERGRAILGSTTPRNVQVAHAILQPTRSPC